MVTMITAAACWRTAGDFILIEAGNKNRFQNWCLKTDFMTKAYAFTAVTLILFRFILQYFSRSSTKLYRMSILQNEDFHPKSKHARNIAAGIELLFR